MSGSKNKLYIFDLDDTLINNQEVDYKSFQLIFDKYNIHTAYDRTILELRKKGYTASKLISDWVIKCKVTHEELMKERNKLLLDPELWDWAKLNKGVKRTLILLKRFNHKVIVATKKPKKLAKQILNHLDIEQYFKEVHGSKDKITLLNQLVDKHKNYEIVFIGDSPEELKEMKDKNIKTFCYPNPYHGEETVAKYSTIVHNMMEVLQ